MDEGEREQREKEIACIDEMGDRLKEREIATKKNIPIDFGICNTCSKFTYIEYEGYGDFIAFCNVHYDTRVIRTPKKKIVRCSDYWSITYKSVTTLAEIAMWLEFKKGGQIGF